MVGGRGECVLSGPAKKIKSEGGKVGDGLGSVLVGLSLEIGSEGPEDGKIDWPDSRWGRVIIGPGFEEGSEAKGIPGPIRLGILEAQSGKLLPHSM